MTGAEGQLVEDRQMIERRAAEARRGGQEQEQEQAKGGCPGAYTIQPLDLTRSYTPCEYRGLSQIMERVKELDNVMNSQWVAGTYGQGLGESWAAFIRLSNQFGTAQALEADLNRSISAVVHTHARQALQACAEQLQELGFMLDHPALQVRSLKSVAEVYAPPSQPPYQSVLDLPDDIPF